MPPVYSQTCVNARLQAVANLIDAAGGNGFLLLLNNSTVISRVQLARPCGLVNGGVLTFLGTLVDPAAASSGTVNTGQMTDSNGTVVISGLTVGTPLQQADIIINNGLSTTVITAGQTVQVLAAQIIGS